MENSCWWPKIGFHKVACIATAQCCLCTMLLPPHDLPVSGLSGQNSSGNRGSAPGILSALPDPYGNRSKRAVLRGGFNLPATVTGTFQNSPTRAGRPGSMAVQRRAGREVEHSDNGVIRFFRYCGGSSSWASTSGRRTGGGWAAAESRARTASQPMACHRWLGRSGGSPA